MFQYQKLAKKKVQFIGLIFLIFTLVLYPSFLHKPSFSTNPSTQIIQSNHSLIAQKSTEQKSDKQSQSSEKDRKQASGEEKEKENKLDPIKMAMGFLGGLVLFLYGVTLLADGLRDLGGDRAKEIIRKFTANPLAGVLTGTVATTILDSSSVTIILVIALVDAALLSFAHSLSVVLGSNIGTTIGAQLIAFNIDEYGPIAMVIGAGLHFFGKSDRLKKIGLVVFGFGLLFFGLYVIGNAMEPFENYQPFLDLMERLADNPLQGAAIGALFTVLVQSSSATVAIIVTLASQGLIGLPAGIALMLGAEVGTCADTLVASIGRGNGALKTGIFHLLFNVTTAAIGIALASQLAGLAETVSLGGGTGRQIANAQLIFNLVGVAAVIGFLPLIAQILEKLLPSGKARSQSQPAEMKN